MDPHRRFQILQASPSPPRRLVMTDARDYARLFWNAPVGISRSTRGGRITHANPALVRLLGYDSEDEVLALDLAREALRLTRLSRLQTVVQRLGDMDCVHDVDAVEVCHRPCYT